MGEKTNEITEVPRLLELLDIEVDVVTADAMGCQPTMEKEVKAYFDDMPKNREEAAKAADWASPVEKGHGRIEKRTVTVAPCGWFEDKGQ